MFSPRTIIKSFVFAVIVLSSLGMSPRSTAQGLQQKLEKQYALTKPTDDKSDIVTAGAVLILEKDKLLMYPTTQQVVPQNTYKSGKLSAGAFAVHDGVQKFGNLIGHSLPSQTQVQTRNFVTGEKFWVTKIDVMSDGVVFTLFTDAVQDVRYDSTLKFMYPKGSAPSDDQVLSMVAEVFKVQPDDSAKSDDSGNQQQGGDANQQGGDQQQPAADAPAPANIQLGMTVDQVEAALGQPDKKVTLGTKLIYVYKDLKVTFVNGKVTDAQ